MATSRRIRRFPFGCENVLLFFWLDLLAIRVVSAAVGSTSSGTKCLKNADISDIYTDNVYYCQDASKPECCEENQLFTCCETQTAISAKHQVALWGSVFGIVGVVAFVWVCYRKDTYMCEGQTLQDRLRKCCRCGRKKAEDEDQLSDISKDDKRQEVKQKRRVLADAHAPGNPRGDVIPLTELYIQRQALQVSRGREAKGARDAAGGYDTDSGRGSVISGEPPGGEAGGGRYDGGGAREREREKEAAEPDASRGMYGGLDGEDSGEDAPPYVQASDRGPQVNHGDTVSGAKAIPQPEKEPRGKEKDKHKNKKKKKSKEKSESLDDI